MADVNEILSALRRDLIAAGLVRHPATAGSLPPLHVERREGAPAPGDLEGTEDDAHLVVHLSLSGDLSEAPGDDWRRRTVVDMRYRSADTQGLQQGRTLDAAIVDRLVHRADYGVGYILDATGPSPVFILQAMIFGGLGTISRSAAGYDELAKYVLEVHR